MAWLSGWSYKKEITITGQSGAGTNYQVPFSIGDSAGGDFHLEGHCTNFPQDIEVTDNDGTTLLDFWIEDITTDPIKMWVEVTDDLGTNQTIYVYYGKSGATTNSNGANTFLQYHGGATADFIDSLSVDPTVGVIYEGRCKVTSATHNIRWGLSNLQNPETDDSSYIIAYSPADNRYIVCENEGASTYYSENPTFSNGVYYKLKVINTGSIVTGFVDNDQIGSTNITTNLPNENLGLFMYFTDGTGAQDWSFARKYNSPEPAFSSAGSEETPPGVGNPHWYYQMLKRRN